MNNSCASSSDPGRGKGNKPFKLICRLPILRFSPGVPITVLIAILSLAAAASPSIVQDDDERVDNWHQFRGPTGNGTAPNADPPTEWSEEKNIKWKVEIPGRGSATPKVWNDKVYVLTSIKTDKRGEPKVPEARQMFAPPTRSRIVSLSA